MKKRITLYRKKNNSKSLTLEYSFKHFYPLPSIYFSVAYTTYAIRLSFLFWSLIYIRFRLID
ncbi:MAG: hypothetical protein J6M59_10800 [Bacteroidaceae bacterium]|nr:hypothetical protein [Bacteroidaceae bacterium]